MAGARKGGRSSADAAEFNRLVQEAKDRHNLSDIISRHTKLKKRGPRELVGLCPFHQERSPSFEVNDGKGTYHCWGCGEAGDAITFLVKKERLTFIQTVEQLLGDFFPTISDEERVKRKADDEKAMAARITIARDIWSRSVPAAGTPAEIYARSRGITIPLPETVRFVMTPRWRNDETGEVGRDYPAMACALQDVHGAIVGVQCVFLAAGGRRKYERVREDGTKAKAKLSFGMIVGSAFRLGPPSDHVILCEGPEDGLTLWQEMPDRSIWVACGTAMLPRVALPSSINYVSLAGDNNDAGRAAVEAAVAAYMGQGLPTTSFYPDPEFKDWNDQLRGVRV
ncbi:MAG: CHC2 zinc finger domain-containing protein [Sphingobium sp.]|uniref:CHC2 zinc finger domain-containing protein n=1 Tax=Sphingobium sp. TaxID=1912891 RepID=UPI003BB10395